MNRSHIMNVLSYENYCLKVKLQELLEKIARLQGEKIEKGDIQNNEQSPPRTQSETSSEEEYKEIINKKDIEIEQLKDIIATLTAAAAANTKEENSSTEPYTTTLDDEKIAQYEAAISALQEQHKLLHENAAQHQSTISSYQEQHKLLQDNAAQQEAAIVALQEQHKLLHENAAQHASEMEAMKNAFQEEREQFRTIIVGKDAEISHYKR